MPRGGRRPGAGRPRAAQKTALQLAADAEQKATGFVEAGPLPAGEFETPDPGLVLGLVARGKTTMPDGTEITPVMVSAAKELLPYYKPKLSSTNRLEERRGPPEDIATDELKYERADLARRLSELEASIAALDAAYASAVYSGGRGADPPPGSE